MSTPTTIDVTTLRELAATGDGPRLVDARTPGEFAAGNIEGHRAPHATSQTVVAALTDSRG